MLIIFKMQYQFIILLFITKIYLHLLDKNPKHKLFFNIMFSLLVLNKYYLDKTAKVFDILDGIFMKRILNNCIFRFVREIAYFNLKYENK